jgi:hypothetical protein
MVRCLARTNAPRLKLTEACSRQPGPGARSLCEYVILYLELARQWNIRVGYERVNLENAREKETASDAEGMDAGPALTHVARHVREETRVLPLDTAHRLVVLRLRDRSPFCVPLHGQQD